MNAETFVELIQKSNREKKNTLPHTYGEALYEFSYWRNTTKEFQDKFYQFQMK